MNSSCAMRERLQGCFLQAQATPLGSLVPEHHKTMQRAVEDIFQCSSVVTWAAGLSVCRKELKLLTDDGTMKVALSVKGYTKIAQRTSPDAVDMPRNLHKDTRLYDRSDASVVRRVRSPTQTC